MIELVSVVKFFTKTIILVVKGYLGILNAFLTHPATEQFSEVVDADNIIMDEDIRYWMLTDKDIQDMETTVTDNPSDIHMWIKLAYKKMYDRKRWAVLFGHFHQINFENRSPVKNR